MRHGCCISMLGTGEDPVGMQYIPLVKELGFDYVELPVAQVTALDAAGYARLKALLVENDLPCETGNNLFPATVRLTGPQVSPAATGEYLGRALGRMAELGAKVLVFGSSGAKNIPQGFPRDEAFRQVVQMLEQAARQVQAMGAVIAIECLNKGEANFINNLAEGLELMRAVDSPSVRLLVDYYHYALENETEAGLRAAAPALVHAHMARPAGRGVPAAGDEDCAAFVGQLRGLGYGGRMSLEAKVNAPREELAAYMDWVKTLG